MKLPTHEECLEKIQNGTANALEKLLYTYNSADDMKFREQLLSVLSDLSANKKYVWLDKEKGFSSSWDSKVQELYVDQKIIDGGTLSGAKLIEYRCLNDNEFELKK